jgi:hypothetical protein
MQNRNFFLFITDEGEPTKVEQFKSLDELRSRVKKLLAEKDKYISRQVHVVFGEKWEISAGPFPYIVPPNGDATGLRIPLFDEEKPQVPNPDGFLGVDNEDLDPHYVKATKSMKDKAKKQPAQSDSDSPFDS